ncbi:MAG: hypothetical protein WCJ86_02680 [Candidatus Saccharibacteria bacterium]|jgi:hypothetical protein
MKKTAWQIYFIMFTMVAIGTIISTPSDNKATVFTYMDLFISLPSLVALYGWAWKKQILNKSLWMIYAQIFITVDVIYNVFFDGLIKEDWRNAILGLVLFGPLYYAMILYGIKFNDLNKISN